MRSCAQCNQYESIDRALEPITITVKHGYRNIVKERQSPYVMCVPCAEEWRKHFEDAVLKRLFSWGENDAKD